MSFLLLWFVSQLRLYLRSASTAVLSMASIFLRFIFLIIFLLSLSLFVLLFFPVPIKMNAKGFFLSSFCAFCLRSCLFHCSALLCSWVFIDILSSYSLTVLSLSTHGLCIFYLCMSYIRADSSSSSSPEQQPPQEEDEKRRNRQSRDSILLFPYTQATEQTESQKC